MTSRDSGFCDVRSSCTTKKKKKKKPVSAHAVLDKHTEKLRAGYHLLAFQCLVESWPPVLSSSALPLIRNNISLTDTKAHQSRINFLWT